MADVTILYYSSCREERGFEEKVIERLVSVAGDLPIISVTQKPLNLGHNICVGDVGASYVNLVKQILVGARAATTKWIADAQADCLLPEGFYDFEPGPLNVYAYVNAWLLRAFDPFRFVYRGKVEGLAFTRREWLIERAGPTVDHLDWSAEHVKSKSYWSWKEAGLFDGPPAIVCKTGGGIGKTTGHGGVYVPELPWWGTARALSEQFGLWREEAA